jgi:hypothetical protein
MDQIKRKSGQAITEYILLLGILVSLYSLFLRLLSDTKIADRIKSRLEKDYQYTYRYGHPEARGPDDGGVKNIPQHDPIDDFRIFINPPIK